MKKNVLSLIAMILLCTMCIGFVACNDDPPTPEPSEIDLYDFAKETEFSFGKFVEGEIIGHGNRYLYGDSYVSASATTKDPAHVNKTALLMANDVAYQSTVSAMQSVFDKYCDEVGGYGLTEDMIVQIGSRDQVLADYIERKQGAFIFSNYLDTNNRITTIEEMEIGEKYLGDCLIKKEDREGWLVAYFYKVTLTRYSIAENYDQLDNQLAHIAVEFSISMYNKTNGTKVNSSVVFELIYSSATIDCSSDFLPYSVIEHSTIMTNILNTATVEETLTMGQKYYEVIEEVVNAWFNDPRGQAYLNKYYNR